MTESAFLRDICEHPSDDVTRLVFADWLEDQGQGRRAEFIRCEIQQALLTCSLAEAKAEGWSRDYCNNSLCEHCCLYGRARVIESSMDILGTIDGDGRRTRSFHDMTRWAYVLEGWDTWRGFVHRITLPLNAFLLHAKALLSMHPIEEVCLSDKEPSPYATPYDRPGYCWRTDYQCPFPSNNYFVISNAIHRYVIGPRDSTGSWTMHLTREEALADLSRACVAWGRQQAGLLPLEG